jgi:hypothetical protein
MCKGVKRSKKMEAQLNETLDKLDITNDKLDDATEECPACEAVKILPKDLILLIKIL